MRAISMQLERAWYAPYRKMLNFVSEMATSHTDYKTLDCSIRASQMVSKFTKKFSGCQMLI